MTQFNFRFLPQARRLIANERRRSGGAAAAFACHFSLAAQVAESSEPATCSSLDYAHSLTFEGTCKVCLRERATLYLYARATFADGTHFGRIIATEMKSKKDFAKSSQISSLTSMRVLRPSLSSRLRLEICLNLARSNLRKLSGKKMRKKRTVKDYHPK